MIRVTFVSFCCKITKNFKNFKTFEQKNANLHILFIFRTFAPEIKKMLSKWTKTAKSHVLLRGL